MTVFIGATKFPDHIVRGYRGYSSYATYPNRYHFRKHIYNWCLENKIRYRRVSSPFHGFEFEREEDIVAIKLRWL